VPVPVRRFFAKHKDATVRERAEKVLGKWNETPDDIKAQIAAKKKACLEGEPDLEQGRVLFAVTCATCHKFHGGGQEVGPELIGVGRANLEALLANVIDPNQIIGRGYENFLVTTKDGRTLSGRVIEDTPTQVTLLGIGARREVVARDQIATLTNTGQSMMPLGFGALPDEQFRNLIWFALAPPEEGPLTKEKKEALSRSIDAPRGGGLQPPAGQPPARQPSPRVDWESISLWNPDWKVVAPEFEGSPRRLDEYHGRRNVLEIHPFEQTRNRPAFLERTAPLAAGQPSRLTFFAAAHDKGDWQLVVLVDGTEVKRQLIDHDGERWKSIDIDLSRWQEQRRVIRIEAWANNWLWEFAYLSDLKVQ
jgi:putative heme-binding domain-containing protein